jgi:hypothetical protein
MRLDFCAACGTGDDLQHHHTWSRAANRAAMMRRT